MTDCFPGFSHNLSWGGLDPEGGAAAPRPAPPGAGYMLIGGARRPQLSLRSRAGLREAI
jgi:hypothetical protein